ncbi:MAG TPA: hypothetical protein VFE05_20545 [Longimicrobiaceae bacterium]|jgi:hypothetical protein|nr:hypothetical protein [Longimicrobiaceae bacterium]
METLLRRYAEWRGQCKAAQVIVFDGAAEIERTRSFMKGAATGIILSFATLALAAPGTVDPDLLRETQHRADLVREAEGRVRQATALANTCLATAQHMEQTLDGYQRVLKGK